MAETLLEECIGERSINGMPWPSVKEILGLCSGSWMKAGSISPIVGEFCLLQRDCFLVLLGKVGFNYIVRMSSM